MDLTVQSVIIQFLNSSPGQYDNIHGRQPALLQTHGLADQPFEAVAIDGTANVLLAHDQPETRMAQCIGRGQCHQALAMDLVNCLVENIPIRLGVQQAKTPRETLTRH